MNNDYWKSLIDANVPIFPLKPGCKRPLLYWKDVTSVEKWQKSKDDLTKFATGPKEFNFGLICCDFAIALDFDSDAKETFNLWLAKMSKEDPSIFDRVYIERTPHGYHVVFRSTIKKKNEVLAERPSIKGKLDNHGDPEEDKERQTLIETRAEGGFLVIAPTPGYVKMRGDLANLPILTEDEVNTLYRVSRSFSKFSPVAEEQAKSDGTQRTTYDYTGWQICDPYVRYSSEFSLSDWQEVLKKYGWRFLGTTEEGRYRYQRPGKKPGDDDFSGDLKCVKGCWFLHVFTTKSNIPHRKGITGIKFLQYEVCEGDLKKAISLAAKSMCGARLYALSTLCNNQ